MRVSIVYSFLWLLPIGKGHENKMRWRYHNFFKYIKPNRPISGIRLSSGVSLCRRWYHPALKKAKPAPSPRQSLFCLCFCLVTEHRILSRPLLVYLLFRAVVYDTGELRTTLRSVLPFLFIREQNPMVGF